MLIKEESNLVVQEEFERVTLNRGWAYIKKKIQTQPALIQSIVPLLYHQTMSTIIDVKIQQITGTVGPIV